MRLTEVPDPGAAVSGAPEPEVGLGDRNFVQSVARGLQVLRGFSATCPTPTVADLARETTLSRATVRRVLLTLQTLGYVEAHGRRHVLLPQVLDLGYASIASLGLPGLVQPHLDALDKDVEESCSAGVLSADGDVVYVARARSSRLLSAVAGVGSRLPATSTAIGRVLLGRLDDEQVRQHIAARPAPAHTQESITDPGLLLEEVRKARLHGFAIASEELELGFRAVAVPLRDAAGSIVAAVNVGMHAGRISIAETHDVVVPMLRVVAADIERDLALHPMPL